MGKIHLSFHAGKEGKLKKNNIKGLMNHSFRKTEQVYKTHKNEQIDTTKTEYNIDHYTGGLSLDRQVDERVENEFKGKRALRKDAVVAREIVIQPSAEIFEGATMAQRQELMMKFTTDSMEWMEDEFTTRNIMGYSIHMDETSPHVHVPIMMMTEDGRFNQKEFFKSPADLKRMHREYREHMNNLGWDFETENKHEDAASLPLHEYKANAKTLEKMNDEYTKTVRSLRNTDELRNEARQQLMDELREDEGFMRIARATVKAEERPKVKKELREELKDEVVQELRVELAPEVKQDIRTTAMPKFKERESKKLQKHYQELFKQRDQERKEQYEKQFKQRVAETHGYVSKVSKAHIKAIVALYDSPTAKHVPMGVKKELADVLNEAPDIREEFGTKLSEYTKKEKLRMQRKKEQRMPQTKTDELEL